MNWKKISAKKKELDHLIKEELLEHWNQLQYGKKVPEMFRRFLPDNVEYFLFQDNKTLGDLEEHAHAMQQLDREGDQGLHVYGTMDASTDDNFQHLNKKYGWRTIIYIGLSIIQETIPGSKLRKGRQFRIFLPSVLVSREPGVFDECQLENTICAVNTVLTAMLLRVGVTFLASHSDHLWDSVPGALFLVSTESVYEANDTAKQWFDLDLSPRNPIELSSVFPPGFCRWIRETIGASGIYSEEDGSCIVWLDETKRVRGNLRPYKPWINIRASNLMSTGYRGITGEDIHRRLHLLLLQDVTLEWEAEMLQQEITLARQIQIGLQPERMPQTEFYDIVATCEPAKHIGGDLYDAIILADGRIALVIGDATGHGVHSALLGALVTGAFRGCVDYDPEPEVVLESVDCVLRNTNHHGFVTLIYMLLDPRGQSMRYGLAGHYPPMIIRNGRDVCQTDTPSSLPLGISLPSMYHFGECKLVTGDIIAAFSDGLLECRNSSGEMFQNAIPGIIRKTGKLPSQAILNEIVFDASQFADDNMIEDDLTAIIIKVNDPDLNRATAAGVGNHARKRNMDEPGTISNEQELFQS
jgi:serine phosphatase RsbU (regulator of sigma subunit)